MSSLCMMIKISEILPPGVYSLVFAQYVFSGLTNVTQRYSARNLSALIKANLHFSLGRSGVLTLDRAKAIVEISKWVEHLKKDQTIVDDSTTSEKLTVEASAPANSSSEIGFGESPEEGNGSLNADGNGSSPASDNKEAITEKKLKKRTFRVQLKIIEKTDGARASLSDKSLADAEQRLAELNKKYSKRKRIVELKNNLKLIFTLLKKKCFKGDYIV